MKIILIIVFILISSCSTNKVVKNHGTSFIKNKSMDLVVNKSNKNDVLEILVLHLQKAPLMIIYGYT